MQVTPFSGIGSTVPGDDPGPPDLVHFRPRLDLGLLDKYRHVRAHLGKEAEHHAAHRELGEKLVGEHFCEVGPLGTITIEEQHGVVRVEQKVLRDCESSQK